MKTRNVFSIAAILIAMASPAYSTLLVYEGFNYSLSNNVTLAGSTTTATGLSGSYSATNSGQSLYQTSGLSFSGFAPSTGGSLLQTAVTSGSFSIIGAQLATGAQTGTLYQSYLFNFSALSSGNTALAVSRINTSATASGTTSFLGAYADNNAPTGTALPGVAYDSSSTSATGAALSLDTTYLFVSRFTNVGTALGVGSPGVASGWVFTETAYDNWLADGSNEANLSTFATYSMSDSVTTGTFTFDDTRFAQFGIFAQTTAQTL